MPIRNGYGIAVTESVLREDDKTGRAGWGAWIRTRGWRNQNPPKSIDINALFKPLSHLCRV
jgi:hypothetical protein